MGSRVQFVDHLAFVLRIDISMIRVVDIVSEDTPCIATTKIIITEYRQYDSDPRNWKNGSGVTIPPVAYEYNQYNNESVNLDGERDHVSY